MRRLFVTELILQLTDLPPTLDTEPHTTRRRIASSPSDALQRRPVSEQIKPVPQATKTRSSPVRVICQRANSEARIRHGTGDGNDEQIFADTSFLFNRYVTREGPLSPDEPPSWLSIRGGISVAQAHCLPGLVISSTSAPCRFSSCQRAPAKAENALIQSSRLRASRRRSRLLTPSFPGRAAGLPSTERGTRSRSWSTYGLLFQVIRRGAWGNKENPVSATVSRDRIAESAT
ncbi:hypothetical protein QBC39DRAFT_18951 [Podospora conica]|nr:hypothetical protein QBC39DRAFT_18951 [Schizothecium conicum]